MLFDVLSIDCNISLSKLEIKSMIALTKEKEIIVSKILISIQCVEI